MKKLIIYTILIISFTILSIACQPTESKASTDDYNDWQTVLKRADGKTVNFYGWGGDERINLYLDETLAPYLKKNYGVTLNRIPMDIDVIMSTLSSEKLAGASESVIDVLWINGENFAVAKEQGFLMPSITNYVPNYQYVSDSDKAVNFDFGTPTEGFESPYGKAQFVLIANQDQMDSLPSSAEALMDYCKSHPQRITYVAPPDFTGSAFVRNIIFDIVGEETMQALPNDKAAVKAAIQPALDYLIALNQHLWQNGDTYPSTYAELDQMYQEGLLDMSMNYDPFSVISKVDTGVYPPKSVAFAFDKGSLCNTHFVAISNSAPNKDAALCLVDAILSPQMQASKMDPKVWGSLSVLDLSQLKDKQKKRFDEISINPQYVDMEMLNQRQVAEPPSYIIPIIEELWQEEVAGKHE